MACGGHGPPDGGTDEFSAASTSVDADEDSSSVPAGRREGVACFFSVLIALLIVSVDLQK